MSAQMIDVITETLRTRYINHEISADEFAAHMEDIALVSRKR